MAQPERILVVGGDASVRERFVAELRGAGHATAEAPGLDQPTDALLILVTGGAPGSRRDGFSAVLDVVVRARALAREAAVVACIPRELGAEAIEAACKSGADDVLVCPPYAGLLLARVRAGLLLAGSRAEVERADLFAELLSQVAREEAFSLDAPEALHDALARAADAVGFARAALLLRRPEDPAGLLLVAASDDAAAMKIPLVAKRYPEVQEALATRAPVLVEDTARSPLLGEWAALAAEKGGPALFSVPLLAGGEAVGALLLRHAEVHPQIDERAREFLRLFSAALAAGLKAGRVFEALREQTNRRAHRSHDEERRTRALAQYRDFLESSSDGVVVLDAEARVVYVNRAGQLMTGFAREGLVGRGFGELVRESQRPALLGAVRDAAGGAQVDPFDLTLTTTSGESLIVSVATSSGLREHDAAILSFRDVTERRALEGELGKTKDFLERLIDSTVDGIIAADLRGQIMIFNQGAARLFGIPAEEVVGKIPVWRLYPEGVARAIMAELRAPEHGGVGRLEPSRRDIVSKDGELVPVTLTASIIYEDGQEVATVGVVSDLRERLKIEQRLAQAQQKLLLTEKQAIIAELAGTTAHELNQPLTSVVGYAELVKKRIQPEDPNYRAVDIILREAERMAEIVRKIGRITRYETKAYVGSTQILDLDKSTKEG